MIHITVKWVCSNCGSNNLANKKGLLACSICGKKHDSEELFESEAENVPLPIDYWEPPFAEDKISWNLDILRRMYASIYRSDVPGEYTLFDLEGNSRLINRTQLLLTKMATLRLPHLKDNSINLDEQIKESYPDQLWLADAQDHYLNQSKLEELGLTFLGAVSISGINGYLIGKADSADYHFYTNWMCKKMGLLCPV